jgi:hypothetical protein
MRDALRLPYPGYLVRVVRMSAGMWLLVRLFAFLVVALATEVSLDAAIQATYGIPALLVWIDRKRSHELLLHANLGASELWFWGVSLASALALDFAANAFLLSI